MSLFGFLKKEKAEPVSSARLVWFELQVAPSSFRFAFTPGQPILVGYADEKGKKLVSTLVSPEEQSSVYVRTVGQVDAILRKNEILYLPLAQTELAFAPGEIVKPGLHIRFAYGDDMSWASVYPRDKLPPPIATLLTEIKTLARQVVQQVAPESAPGYAAAINPPSEMMSVKVTRTGAIIANGRELMVTELHKALDDLRAKGGELSYSREAPNEEPTEATTKSIQLLIEAVMERQLRFRLETPPEELLS